MTLLIIYKRNLNLNSHQIYMKSDYLNEMNTKDRFLLYTAVGFVYLNNFGVKTMNRLFGMPYERKRIYGFPMDIYLMKD